MSAGSDAAALLQSLVDGSRFAAIRLLAPELAVPQRNRERISRLADAGDRLLDLDAEDFEVVAAEVGMPPHVVQHILAATFPTDPHQENRGSMRSLVPLYQLMLEVLTARLHRSEPMDVVSVLHLMAEYLPLLAWQDALGHAGDPVRLAEDVRVPGGLWGTRSPACYHTASQRAAAERVLHAESADGTWWEAYLNRYHSRTAEALGRCATHPTPGRPTLEGVCRRPCNVWEQYAPEVKTVVGARVHLARSLAESPVVALRHHAPVGHFFGVPSMEEVAAQWQRTWDRLAKPWADGANPLQAPAEPVPDLVTGMGSVVSAVAGRPIGPGVVIETVKKRILAELHSG